MSLHIYTRFDPLTAIRQLGGKDTGLIRLCRLYLLFYEQQISELSQALEQNDIEHLLPVVHRIRSGLIMLHAGPACRLATSMEAMMRQDQCYPGEEMGLELITQLVDLAFEIRQYLALADVPAHEPA